MPLEPPPSIHTCTGGRREDTDHFARPLSRLLYSPRQFKTPATATSLTTVTRFYRFRANTAPALPYLPLPLPPLRFGHSTTAVSAAHCHLLPTAPCLFSSARHLMHSLYLPRTPVTACRIHSTACVPDGFCGFHTDRTDGPLSTTFKQFSHLACAGFVHISPTV